jgi:hypothetical protein
VRILYRRYYILNFNFKGGNRMFQSQKIRQKKKKKKIIKKIKKGLHRYDKKLADRIVIIFILTRVPLSGELRPITNKCIE